ncbi:threonine transporter RhtB [Erwinia sp. OLTSP20]|uniref:LysE family translocator n=1 Tax=unclassified Erwinia TaxID=2622719 RepID=UPI000C189E97|nr:MULTISPECIES: LysE family translocator [unclassified Erwinia]PIJ50961.1 threonine transporter RhtB [Erwinia sp. OAMSP11]PIJ75981.1 threonine transporter RhtB [Erwinia sp. OLSSP12]PIJ83642.1 threonine transporter RhtB [Erwinia sp. OLCASP19]PIJ87499.1 threonine transporter RhtB [Erwinia sp. OLMTSP26]PIJ89048.1 threonine transporter RhtB [Erwinia sp. OLMDSP33]
MTASLISFLIAITLLTLTPGFDTALILRTSAAHGWRKAAMTALGINMGCLLWGSAVGFGLGALLLASELAYNVLKIAGALYLLWLGFGLLLRPRASLASPQASTVKRQGAGAFFIKGFLGNLLNPKVGIFYVSFLPQFIPAEASVALWSLVMAAIHDVIGLSWAAVLIFSTHYFAAQLRRPPVMKTMDRMTGLVFIGFAARLALSRR